MVVVYESFPSDIALINKAHQSYRASLQNQIEDDNEIIGQSSDDSSSLKTIYSETQDNSGKSYYLWAPFANHSVYCCIETNETSSPRGFHELWKQTNLDLNTSSTNIDEPVHQVQKLVGAQLVGESIDEQAYPLTREQQHNCNEDISFVLSDESIAKSTRSMRTNRTSSTATSSIRATVATPTSATKKNEHTSFNKNKTNNSAPRYLNVDRKTFVKPVEQSHFVRVNERIIAMQSKQNRTEMYVPVVQIKM